MAIYYQSRNRLYCRTAHDNRMRFNCTALTHMQTFFILSKKKKSFNKLFHKKQNPKKHIISYIRLYRVKHLWGICSILNSAVKQLIAINHIWNKSFYLRNICVCTVYMCYIYLWKMLHLHMKYIYIQYKLYEYKYIHVNTCKYFQNIYCMCVFIYT